MTVVFLPIDSPAARIGVQQRDFGLHARAAQEIRVAVEFLAERSDFFIHRNGLAVRADEDSVILLLSVERAAPLPVADVIRTMRDGLPGTRANFALV